MKIEQLFGVEGKVIVITGGTGGIGEGLALGLAENGAEIALIATNTEKIEKAVSRLKEETGAVVRGYSCNITDEAAVAETFDTIWRDFGSIYGLINSAGINRPEYLSGADMDTWRKIMDVNVFGAALCSKYAGKYMERGGEGRIINISSLAATHCKPSYTAYTASKAGLEGLTSTLAAEWGRKHINVNSIAPCMMVSEISRPQLESIPGYLEKWENTIIPQGRTCNAELLLGTVIWLLSEASSFVTGQRIGCDGGAQYADLILFSPEPNQGTVP